MIRNSDGVWMISMRIEPSYAYFLNPYHSSPTTTVESARAIRKRLVSLFSRIHYLWVSGFIERM